MQYNRTVRTAKKVNWFPCGCCWDYNRSKENVPFVGESEICNGKSRSKRKPRPKKKRCTDGQPHRWLYDTTTETKFFRESVKGPCEVCEAQHSERRKLNEYYARNGWHRLVFEQPTRRHFWWCSQHGPKVFYTETRRERICDGCGKFEVVRVTDDRPSWRDDYIKSRRLPKRPVRF